MPVTLGQRPLHCSRHDTHLHLVALQASSNLGGGQPDGWGRGGIASEELDVLSSGELMLAPLMADIDG